jgi:hypothetical protein
VEIDLSKGKIPLKLLREAIDGSIELALLAIKNPDLSTACIAYLNQLVDISQNPTVAEMLEKSEVHRRYKFLKRLIDEREHGEFIKFCSSERLLTMIVDAILDTRNYSFIMSYSPLGKNIHLTEKQVSRLINIDYVELNTNLAKNPNVTEYNLLKLASYTAPVRQGLAKRQEYLPTSVARLLIDDKLSRIADIVVHRKDLDVDIIRELLLKGKSIDRAKAGLEALYKQEPSFAGLIKEQPACPAKLKKQIDKSDATLFSLSQLTKIINAKTSSKTVSVDVSSIKTSKELTALYQENPEHGDQIVKNAACGKALLKKLLLGGFSLSDNPKIQLELMADAKWLEQYLPKREEILYKVARETSCSAVHDYLKKNISWLIEELSRNPNLSSAMSAKLFQQNIFTVLYNHSVDRSSIETKMQSKNKEFNRGLFWFLDVIHKQSILDPDFFMTFFMATIDKESEYYFVSKYNKWNRLTLQNRDKNKISTAKRELKALGFTQILGNLIRLNDKPIIDFLTEKYSPELVKLAKIAKPYFQLND